MSFTQSLIYMVKSSSWFSKLILLVLFFLSIYMLAIIISRFRYYKWFAREKIRIFRSLRAGPNERVITFSRQRGNNPYYSLLRLFEQANSSDELSQASVEIITDFLNSEESKLGFLATTSSIAPFLGLLGTVVGITRAFWSIGLKGSASLLILAPGLAEALITTIAGLTVAIPAVVAYNYLLRQLNKAETTLSNLSSRLISLKSKKRYEE